MVLHQAHVCSRHPTVRFLPQKQCPTRQQRPTRRECLPPPCAAIGSSSRFAHSMHFSAALSRKDAKMNSRLAGATPYEFWHLEKKNVRDFARVLTTLYSVLRIAPVALLQSVSSILCPRCRHSVSLCLILPPQRREQLFQERGLPQCYCQVLGRHFG